MKEDLRHLKWNMINREGLTPREAEFRIEELREIMRKGREEKKSNARKNNSSTRKSK